MAYNQQLISNRATSLQPPRRGHGSLRKSWRTEIHDRLSWVGDATLPPLDDPRELTPLDLSRFSSITDMSLPIRYGHHDSDYSHTDWRIDAAVQTEDFRPIAPPAEIRPPPPTEPAYLDAWTLYVVALGMMLSLICCGLDRSIVAVATPAITSEFHSLQDVGWYGSAYLLTLCCCQLPFGKLFAELDKKYVFLAAVVLFEAGSAICAAAPSSVVFIVGRAVAGIGGAGIISGALIIIGTSIAPSRRASWLGALGAAANIAQAFGPLIGGALVGNVSWRWCFWINLPLGGGTILIIVLFLRLPPPPPVAVQRGRINWLQLLDRIDAPGTMLIIPSIVCLLLVLQWGGTQYPWSSLGCIALLCLFGVLFVTWAYSQYVRGDKATVPIRIITQRSVAFGSVYTMAAFGAFTLLIFYVPMWFQAVRGASALQSGIDLCALVLPGALTLLFSATMTTRFGQYVPQMMAGTVLMSTMAGLIITLRVDTPTNFWVPILVFFGIGIGLGSQQPLVAAQTVLEGPDIALGTSIVVFLQVLSGAIMVSVGQNVLSQRLVSSLRSDAPGVDPQVVTGSGVENLATEMGKIYTQDQVHQILVAYNDALRAPFIVALALVCITTIGCAGMEWRSVKRRPTGSTDIGKEKTTEPSDVEANANLQNDQVTTSTRLPATLEHQASYDSVSMGTQMKAGSSVRPLSPLD